ncbi:MAG: ABC transporter substrate-binding protein [PVC group bacterium]|nr:ABC transporter substrate-binding protein [PVC group bacterium]
MIRKIVIVVLLLLMVTSVQAQDVPQRIISLGPHLTEQLYLLGAEDNIVGVTTYCTNPPRVQEKEKVGTVVEANIEKIIALRPDIVLTIPLTDMKAKEKLRSLGVAVKEFPQVASFSEICEQCLELGRLVGKKYKAKEIISAAKEKMAQIRQTIESETPQKVFIQVGAKPLFTMNKDYFIHDLVECAGGINIAEHASTGIFSREKVVAVNPDLIVITTMGIVGEDEKEVWQRYETISAVKKNKIFIMDSDMVCSPTPNNFINALDKLVKFMYGQEA